MIINIQVKLDQDQKWNEAKIREMFLDLNSDFVYCKFQGFYSVAVSPEPEPVSGFIADFKSGRAHLPF